MQKMLKIKAVAYQEDGAWIAQGVDYDIVAHSQDVLDLADAFARAVVENIMISEHMGKDPRKTLPRAPKEFRLMYESGQMEMKPLGHLGADVRLRVAQAA